MKISSVEIAVTNVAGKLSVTNGAKTYEIDVFRQASKICAVVFETGKMPKSFKRDCGATMDPWEVATAIYDALLAALPTDQPEGALDKLVDIVLHVLDQIAKASISIAAEEGQKITFRSALA